MLGGGKAVRPDRVATLAMAWVQRAGLIRPKPGIPILMYHSVSDDPEPGVGAYYRLATSPQRFRDQMSWLKTQGYRTVGLAEALASCEARWQCDDDRLIVLTFDDGYRDFLTAAWPVLDEMGFTATVFLPTAFIADERMQFKRRDCLTWTEVRSLSAAGIAFGSHTVNHPNLYELTWPRIRSELAESRAALEDEIQAPIRTFAYPYAFPQEDAAFVSALREELAALDYRVGVTTVIGRASPAENSLTMRRLPVNECDDEPLFNAKLAGSYDWLAKVQKLRRRVLRRRPLSLGDRA